MRILIIGFKNELTMHLIHFLTIKRPGVRVDLVETVGSEEAKLYYDYVIYAKNHIIMDEHKESMDEYFGLILTNLNHVMLDIKTNHFIYLDFSFNSFFIKQEMYQKMQELAIKLVEFYNNKLYRYYTIFYLYDLIGYKFHELSPQYINLKLENSKAIIKSDYEFIHFTYITDVVEAIIRSLDDQTVVNTQHHLRYDNNGTSLNKIINLFEKVNYIVYKYKLFTDNKKKAPFSGTPSLLLENKYPMEMWVKQRKKFDMNYLVNE